MSYNIIVNSCLKFVPYRDVWLVVIFLILEERQILQIILLPCTFIINHDEGVGVNWRVLNTHHPYNIISVQMIVIYVRKQEAGSRNHEHLTEKGGTVVLSSGIKANTSAWPKRWGECCSLCQSCYSHNRTSLPKPLYQGRVLQHNGGYSKIKYCQIQQNTIQ